MTTRHRPWRWRLRWSARILAVLVVVFLVWGCVWEPRSLVARL